MLCKYCGSQLPDGSVFCSVCGKSQAETYQTAAQHEASAQQNVNPAWQAPPTQTAQPVYRQPVNSSIPQMPQSKPQVKGRVMWWVFAGISMFILLVAFIVMGVKAITYAASETSVYIPTYVPPVIESPSPEISQSPAPSTSDNWYDDYGTDDNTTDDDWNADGTWVLGEDFLYGEWVSDFFDDGTVECLYFDYNGYVELWEGVPGDSYDSQDTWFDGNWTKNFLYSGTYWVDGDYLTLSFDTWDSSNTYYVAMTGLYDIEIYFDDGAVTHFTQVSW